MDIKMVITFTLALLCVLLTIYSVITDLQLRETKKRNEWLKEDLKKTLTRLTETQDLIRKSEKLLNESNIHLSKLQSELDVKTKVLDSLRCEHEGCKNLKYYTTPIPPEKAFMADYCSVHLVEHVTEGEASDN